MVNIIIPKYELKLLEQKLDELNAEYGTEKDLCIYCEADGYTGEKGIIHENNCPIIKLRKWLK